jgi:hypothetical protein
MAASALTASPALAAAPLVSTGGASATETTATLHATINPEGLATTWYFQYGPTNTYGSVSPTNVTNTATRNESVSATISGLTPGTTYHYRIYASSSGGLSLGADRTFTTAGHPPPTPVTTGISALGRTFAAINGTVLTNGDTTTWAFQYGITTNYGSWTNSGAIAPTPVPVPVGSMLTGLAPGTLFHYRLVAWHGSVQSLGADGTFFTFPFPRLHGRLSAQTLPTIAASKPYQYTTTGTLFVPASLPAGAACNGTVKVRFILAHRTVALRKPTVTPSCTFATSVLFKKLIGGKAQHLRVEIRFQGNNYLVPASARAEHIRLGI